MDIKPTTGKQKEFFDAEQNLVIFWDKNSGRDKTSPCLIKALKDIDDPHHHVAFFKKTRKELDTLWREVKNLLKGMEGVKLFPIKDCVRFPSGAIWRFVCKQDYLDSPEDMTVSNFCGALLSQVYFDKVQQFEEFDVLYMLTRLRVSKMSNVPPQMCLTITTQDRDSKDCFWYTLINFFLDNNLKSGETAYYCWVGRHLKVSLDKDFSLKYGYRSKPYTLITTTLNN